MPFVSEVDPLARAVLLKNHTFLVLFGDILKRDVTDIPRVSIYTAGFPCQPFSAVGDNAGLADSCGTVLHVALSYITARLPVMFMLF